MDVLVKKALLEVYEARSNLDDVAQEAMDEMDVIQTAAGMEKQTRPE
jgi:hypothetical protein